jgi:hypothetical protein
MARENKDDRCFEWIGRFVHAFEKEWDELIGWYGGNTKKAHEWMAFAALRGDRRNALQLARFVDALLPNGSGGVCLTVGFFDPSAN